MTLGPRCSNEMCSSHDAVRKWTDIEHKWYKGKTKKKLTMFGLKERTIPGFFQTTGPEPHVNDSENQFRVHGQDILSFVFVF